MAAKRNSKKSSSSQNFPKQFQEHRSRINDLRKAVDTDLEVLEKKARGAWRLFRRSPKGTPGREDFESFVKEILAFVSSRKKRQPAL